MKINEPLDLFTLELQDMYSAETQITEALPVMIKAANDNELKKGFEMHLKETKEQVKRLEKIGKIMELDVEGKPCEGMKGLLKEGAEVAKLSGEGLLLDMALITGARKVEHYEVLGYNSLILLAKQLKEKEVIDLLKENLGEEEATDKKLAMVTKSEEVADAIGKLVKTAKKIVKG